MFGSVWKVLGAAAVIGAVYVPLHGATFAKTDKPFIQIGAQTLVPYGWADFCRRYSGECDESRLAPKDIELTPQAIKRIQQVNTWVNRTIVPKSDMEHWGVIDRWDYPSDGYGDCEDYVLLKRRILVDEGYPRQALLITVVKDQHGDGHAVLTVKTTKGEYVLDNFEDEVRPWTQSPYEFVKRQSQSDQNVWVSIGQPASNPLVVSR